MGIISFIMHFIFIHFNSKKKYIYLYLGTLHFDNINKLKN